MVLVEGDEGRRRYAWMGWDRGGMEGLSVSGWGCVRGGFVLADGESRRLEEHTESCAASSPCEKEASWTRGALRLWFTESWL